MDNTSVHSAPSSVSGSSARSTPIPHSYKPITPSASLQALAKTPDDELKRRSAADLLGIIRRLEGENRGVISEHSTILKDVNKKSQILLLELRGLKDVNQNLQDDNQELRDLCCFLDDDRQRGRKLAREWQRFGRYTASVMRSEVSAYQEKLKELETKQQELISDNLDLKELCLYLDQERLRASQQRDEGDGSSSSTVAGNDDVQADIELVPISQLNTPAANTDNDAATNEYIRQLENKVRHLEKQKKSMTQNVNRGPTDVRCRETPQVQVTGTQRQGPDGTHSNTSDPQDKNGSPTSPHKPEAVVHAMKVLEVHENLERPQTAVGEDSGLDDKEKAIVREMCNVVWRKLGSVKQDQQQETERDSQSPPVYENLQPSRSKSTPPESATNLSVTNLHPKASPSTADDIHPPGYQHVRERPGDTSFDVRSDSKNRMNNSFAMNNQGQYNTNADSSFRDHPDMPEYHGRSSQGQGHYTSSGQVNQTQRPPPGSYPQPSDPGPPGPPPNPHYITAPKYGYVHTTRSTPVTPTPPQQSLPPAATSGPHKMDAHSHSPGPVRRAHTPKAQGNGSYSHSPGPHNRAQYPPPDAQTKPTPHSQLYQNHPPSNSRPDYQQSNSTSRADYQQPNSNNRPDYQQANSTSRSDHSYENMYYYTNSGSQGHATGHNRTHDSVSSSHAYHADPSPQSHLNSSSQDYYGNPGYQTSSAGGHVSRSEHQQRHQQAPSQRPPISSSSQSPPFYQNMHMPMNSSTPAKGSSRDLQGPNPHNPQQRGDRSSVSGAGSSTPSHSKPPHSGSQFTAIRNSPIQPPPSPAHSHQPPHTAYPQPRYQQGPGLGPNQGLGPAPSPGQAPNYSNPPGYADRRTSYADPRESNNQANQSYSERPSRRDQFYKK